MIRSEAMSLALELRPVGSPTTVSPASTFIVRAAALVLAGAVGFAAASAPAAPAKWTSSLSLAAAFGAVLAIRRSRDDETVDAESLLALAGDFVARHRIDGRVTAIEGEGWTALADDAADLLGYGLVDRFHEEDRGRFLDQLAAVAEDGATRAAALRLRCGEEEFRFVEVASRRAPDNGALVSAFRAAAASRDLAAELCAAREERDWKNP